MDNSPYKYILLYDGCETRDACYYDDYDLAQKEMAKMAQRLLELGVDEKPYIMVFGKTDNGDYLLKSVVGRDKTKIE